MGQQIPRVVAFITGLVSSMDANVSSGSTHGAGRKISRFSDLVSIRYARWWAKVWCCFLRKACFASLSTPNGKSKAPEVAALVTCRSWGGTKHQKARGKSIPTVVQRRPEEDLSELEDLPSTTESVSPSPVNLCRRKSTPERHLRALQF